MKSLERDTTELFEEFKELTASEFFKRNKQMLGFSGKIRSLTIVFHELITNSLDACEEAGILPDITIELTRLGKDHYISPRLQRSYLHHAKDRTEKIQLQGYDKY